MVEGVGHACYAVECTRLKFLYVKGESIPANTGWLSFSLDLHLASYRRYVLGALEAVFPGICQQSLHGLDLFPQFLLLDLQGNILVFEVQRGHPYGKDGDGQRHKERDKRPAAPIPLEFL